MKTIHVASDHEEMVMLNRDEGYYIYFRGDGFVSNWVQSDVL